MGIKKFFREEMDYENNRQKKHSFTFGVGNFGYVFHVVRVE